MTKTFTTDDAYNSGETATFNVLAEVDGKQGKIRLLQEVLGDPHDPYGVRYSAMAFDEHDEAVGAGVWNFGQHIVGDGETSDFKAQSWAAEQFAWLIVGDQNDSGIAG